MTEQQEQDCLSAIFVNALAAMCEEYGKVFIPNRFIASDRPGKIVVHECDDGLTVTIKYLDKPTDGTLESGRERRVLLEIIGKGDPQ